MPRLLFADDFKLYSTIKSIADSVQLQDNLNQVVYWCSENILQLNPLKCRVVTYTNKKKVVLYDYTIQSQVVIRETVINDLGVTFDSTFTFNYHYDKMLSSAFWVLGFVIRNSKKFNNLEVLFCLFYSLVRSKLEYACVVWAPHDKIHKVQLEKIQRIFLKHAVFRTENKYPAPHVSQTVLLEKLGIDSLSKRRFKHSLIFLFKIINSQTGCSGLLEKIPINVFGRAVCVQNILYMPNPRINVFKYSPLYRMCSNYNRVADRLDIFSCKLADIKKLD